MSELATAGVAPGLTTTRAPFIELAQAAGQLYIEQPYELYSAENHQTWSRLLQRMRPRWEHYANPRFLEGIETLRLDPDQVPRCADINRFLEPRTGFKAKPVSGYVPAYKFFDCLKRREFPTTITVRDGGSLDYLPEPDIFHDIAGHVPMHTDRGFADALVQFGQFAERAARRAGEIRDEAERIRVLTSNVKGLVSCCISAPGWSGTRSQRWLTGRLMPSSRRRRVRVEYLTAIPRSSRSFSIIRWA